MSTLQRNYIFTCSKLPITEQSITSVVLPAIMFGESNFPTQTHQIAVPGDVVTPDPLQLEFIVSENMDNYLEIYNWIQSIRNFNPQTMPNYVADATLTVLSNNMNPIASFTLQACFPTFLGELNFGTGDVAGEVQKCQFTLRFVQAILNQ